MFFWNPQAGRRMWSGRYPDYGVVNFQQDGCVRVYDTPYGKNRPECDPLNMKLVFWLKCFVAWRLQFSRCHPKRM